MSQTLNDNFTVEKQPSRDVILLSQDGIQFNVHKHHLSMFSSVFAGMFELEHIVDQDPIPLIPLPGASASVLSDMLPYFYPFVLDVQLLHEQSQQAADSPVTLARLKLALEFVDKYEMPESISRKILDRMEDIARYKVDNSDALAMFMDTPLSSLEPIKTLCIGEASEALGLCAESEIDKLPDRDLKRLNVYRTQTSIIQILKPLQPAETCMHARDDSYLAARYHGALERLCSAKRGDLQALLHSEWVKAGRPGKLCDACISLLAERISAIERLLLVHLDRFRPN